jgi:integrase
MAGAKLEKIEGIDVRHSKKCGTRYGSECNCTPTYQANAYDKRTGRLIRRTFPTKTAAKRWRQEAIVALRHGQRTPLERGRGQTVRQALDALIAGMEDGTALDRSGRRYRPATIRSYRQAADRYLIPALGSQRLAEVPRRDVQRLVDKMHADGLTGSTIRNKLDPLRVIYRRALQDDDVTRNPTTQLRLPALATKPRRIVNADRAAVLLDALPDSERALWATAFYAGLRIGEIRALRWNQVDFDAGVIRVQAGWDDAEGEVETKTEAGLRTIPLVGRLRAELARHRLATGRGGDALCFGRSDTTAFIRSTVRARANRAWEAAKLEPPTPHEARHACASYLAAAGLTHKEVQTAMGHADIRTTLNVYAKAVPGWESGAVAKLDAFLEAGPEWTASNRAVSP